MTSPWRFPEHSLRGRLVWMLSGAILLAAGIQAGMVYRMTRSETDEVFDYQMRQVALALQGGVAPGLPPGRAGAGEDDFDFLIQVWGADGTCLYRSAPDDLPATPGAGFSAATLRRTHYRVYSVVTPARTIRVAQDLEVRRQMAAQLALRAVAPILLLAPGLILAVWLLVRRSTRPILRVQRQVSGRAAEDLAPLDPAGLPQEVRPLVVEINLLFARLDRAFAAQRDFVADAAHELRTPMAALRLQVQGLDRAGTGEARALAVRRLLEGVDRATRLVQQMLVLARQEAGPRPVPAHPVDLVEVAGLAIGDVLAAARARRLDLGMAEGAAGVVSGQPEALRILVRNLLENAVKYTPEEGTVDLAIRTEGPWTVLTVADSGPGIPPGERARAFDRFYRLPQSAQAGSGLGLAIVKAIAEGLGGRVALDRCARLGGLEVSVTLPCAPVAEVRYGA